MPTALVIGGGPAGSTAATLLARAGWSVTLIEQHRFPRDKVCGECLSALGIEVLRRLGLADDVRAAGAVRLDRALLHAPGGTCASARLPRPMWGISRTALDAILLEAATRAGATVLQPARCEKLEPGEPPSVCIRDLASNTVSRLTADWILLADGKSTLLNGRAPPPTRDLGIKTHFENVDGPRDAIELFGLTGCYGGLAPIEGGRWNCALSVPAARVRQHHGDLSRLFEELQTENLALCRRLARVNRVGAWLASPLPRFPVRARWPRGVIPLGNAAAAIEPIGGEGMGLAMRSAELASQALIELPARALHRSYAKLWRKRLVACRYAAALASSPACANFLAPACRAAPWRCGRRLSLMKE